MKTMVQAPEPARRLKTIEDEEWRHVPGTNDMYQISSYGRVRSFQRDPNGKIMKTSYSKGTKTISICFETGRKTVLVHKLIAEAFILRKKPDYENVIHLDGNTRNNHVSNLAWVKREECMSHVLTKLHEKNRERPPRKLVTNSKLSVEDISLLKSMLSKGVKQKVIAKMFCISEMQVSRIKHGANWGQVQAK